MVIPGRIEKWWFGERVYIFSDRRLWIESNFTFNDALNGTVGTMGGGGDD
jgi:hypothetical protein